MREEVRCWGCFIPAIFRVDQCTVCWIRRCKRGWFWSETAALPWVRGPELKPRLTALRCIKFTMWWDNRHAVDENCMSCYSLDVHVWLGTVLLRPPVSTSEYLLWYLVPLCTHLELSLSTLLSITHLAAYGVSQCGLECGIQKRLRLYLANTLTPILGYMWRCRRFVRVRGPDSVSQRQHSR